MKSYLEFERDIKGLEEELDKLIKPLNNASIKNFALGLSSCLAT